MEKGKNVKSLVNVTPLKLQYAVFSIWTLSFRQVPINTSPSISYEVFFWWIVLAISVVLNRDMPSTFASVQSPSRGFSYVNFMLKFTQVFGDKIAGFKVLCHAEYVHMCESDSLFLMANLKQIPLLNSTLIPEY